ncbi:MAG: amylo-alpha-1,6-glucosidase [Candidatus Aenigmarchaeota archaeon]|nr:amylo-alpha-1,6-glucosidase [Candidatus Aenigmarchaeota archaeon]
MSILEFDDYEHAEDVKKLLISKEFLPEEMYGVRTLAKGERNYNPNMYHSGAVWPFISYSLARALMNRGDEIGFKILEKCKFLRKNSFGYLAEVYHGEKPIRQSEPLTQSWYSYILTYLTPRRYESSVVQLWSANVF